MNELTDLIKPDVTIYPIDEPVVQWAMHESTALGPLGAVSGGADIIAIAGVWGTLLWEMSKNHGINLTKEKSGELCKCIAKGAMRYIAGCKAAATLFNLIPGAGTLVAIAGSTIENVIFTYRFARSVTDTMLKEGTNECEWEAKAKKAIGNFAYEFCAADMKEMVDIYFKSDGYMSDVVDFVKDKTVKGTKIVGEKALNVTGTIYTEYQIAKMEVSEKAVEIGRKAVDLSTKVISSPEFKNMERKVFEFADDAKDAIVDFANNAGDAYVDFVDDKIDKIKKWWRNL